MTIRPQRTTLCVQYAKTGRSKCQKSKEMIAKGDVRIGKIFQKPDGESGESIDMTQYFAIVPFFQVRGRGGGGHPFASIVRAPTAGTHHSRTSHPRALCTLAHTATHMAPQMMSSMRKTTKKVESIHDLIGFDELTGDDQSKVIVGRARGFSVSWRVAT